MRVVHLGPYFDPAPPPPERLLTAWRIAPELANAVGSLGHQVSLLLRYPKSVRLEQPHCSVELVPGSLPNLVAQVAQKEPELIHVHGIGYAGLLLALKARLPRVPILAQDHANAPARGPRRALHRLAFGALSGAVFTARQQADTFFEAGVFPRQLPVFEAPEGSTHFGPGPQAEARAQTGLFGDPGLLSVGNLDANKDPLTVLRAVARAVPRLPNLHLWCAYRKAPLATEVEAEIERLGLTQRVHLVGEQPQAFLEQWHRAADLFVSASHKESCGFALIEALACGNAPVATQLPSFVALTGEAGRLVPCDDPAAMAEALVDLARRLPEQRRLLARERFENEIAYPSLARKLDHIYRSLRFL